MYDKVVDTFYFALVYFLTVLVIDVSQYALYSFRHYSLNGIDFFDLFLICADDYFIFKDKFACVDNYRLYVEIYFCGFCFSAVESIPNHDFISAVDDVQKLVVCSICDI